MNRIAATIIRDLAINGPAIGNKIVKRTGLAQSTVYDNLYLLRDDGYIESKEIAKIGGRLGEKEYSLTVLGLATALCFPQVTENLDNVFRSWPDLLPFKLEKWGR